MHDNTDNLRRDLTSMVEDLRATMREIGTSDLPQTAVVTNARDRLRYISALTEQAAGRTLEAAETLLARTQAQQAEAEAMLAISRSPQVRAFLERLVAEHQQTRGDLSEVILAQEFQDLVGQVVNKLVVMVQKMEDSLAHLLIEEEPEGQLAGPAVRQEEKVSQADIDSLFD